MLAPPRLAWDCKQTCKPRSMEAHFDRFPTARKHKSGTPVLCMVRNAPHSPPICQNVRRKVTGAAWSREGEPAAPAQLSARNLPFVTLCRDALAPHPPCQVRPRCSNTIDGLLPRMARANHSYPANKTPPQAAAADIVLVE